jgi:magnesium-protoporphyrin IX monomethyl ester (oxidative) cyclase
MYVRDHERVELYKAFQMDPTDYDFTVFRITSEISRQVFPLTLNLDDPRFRACLDRLMHINQQYTAAKAAGGILNKLKGIGLAARAALTFGRLYLLPAQANALPTDVRLAPAW